MTTDFPPAQVLHGLPPEMAQCLQRIWPMSQWLQQLCIRQADWLPGQDLRQPFCFEPLLQACPAPDEAARKQALRVLRQRAMLWIVWRDLASWSELDETLQALSAAADGLIETALSWLEPEYSARFGQPQAPDGSPCRLIVFGLGKLGGGELNMSSDVDLVFAYAHDGETPGPKRIEHAEYFKRLSKALVQLLAEPTEDGFVYRVDTMLRPFGSAGPLAISTDALEHYCQVHGREWERYAWIKARPVAGDLAGGAAALESLRPFIYRRYLDYGVFESLRDMKRKVAAEAARRGQDDDIKLGAGGIREIEFIAQAFQLVRGGQEPRLQLRSLRQTLAQLRELELMPAAAVAELDEAYVQLRRLENRIQAWRDEQTHCLPHLPAARAALALAMGCNDWPALLESVDALREQVRQQFERIFAAPHAEVAEDDKTQSFAELWNGELSEAAACAALQDMGFAQAQASWRLLQDLRERSRARLAGESGRQRLAKLMPLILQVVAAQPQPDALLGRLAEVLLAIVGRSSYLSLLLENPAVISQLVKLCAASAWIAGELARHPASLDQLLDPRVLYAPPRKAELQAELQEQTQALAEDDLEQQMELLRRFKHSQVLRVAAADVSGAVPLMVVSDHLTEIAEVLVERALAQAWEECAARYGAPDAAAGDAQDAPSLCILAYGKLGGLELGYGSDLDLVFIHAGNNQQMTAGPKPVEYGQFYTRLVQRIVHLLNTVTPSGVVYEVDLRLRPSGASGLVVSSWTAYAQYQSDQAWTWEHQALVRARPVAGSEVLGAQFVQLRESLLCRQRNAGELRHAVLEMREKMRSQLDKSAGSDFDLKQGAGGITDIEFMVQYCVLRWAHKFPALVGYTDNIRCLEQIALADLPLAAQAEPLAEVYRDFRQRLHRHSLQQAGPVTAVAAVAQQRALVLQAWRLLFA